MKLQRTVLVILGAGLTATSIVVATLACTARPAFIGGPGNVDAPEAPEEGGKPAGGGTGDGVKVVTKEEAPARPDPSLPAAGPEIESDGTSVVNPAQPVGPGVAVPMPPYPEPWLPQPQPQPEPPLPPAPQPEPEPVVPLVPVVHPKVVSTTPAQDQTGVARKAKISVTFSMPMHKASTQQAFYIVSPAANNTGNFTWDASGKVMTFTPNNEFAYGTVVQWQVAKTARDAIGVPMANDFAASFLSSAARRSRSPARRPWTAPSCSPNRARVRCTPLPPQ